MLLDNAGNTILEIGRSGNFDSQFINPHAERATKGKAIVTVPAIPLCWPTGAGFGKKYLYINDTGNRHRRVVRVALTHTLEVTSPVK